MSSNIPCKDRWYEDFSVGESFTLGSVSMDAEEMLDFSTRFDPQRFHIDAAAAADTIYGSLIASGWHTGSLMMRLLAEGFLGEASQGSVGISEVTWPSPVRAGCGLFVIAATPGALQRRQFKSACEMQRLSRSRL